MEMGLRRKVRSIVRNGVIKNDLQLCCLYIVSLKNKDENGIVIV